MVPSTHARRIARPFRSVTAGAAFLALATLALSGCGQQTDLQSAAVPETPAEAPRSDSSAPAPSPVRSPRAMPDFVLQDLSGRTVRLSDYAGKAVLLNFWATWCPPCKAELPDLVDLQNTHGGDRFTVIGVSLDQTGVDGVRAFVNDQGLNYPVLMGNEDVVIQYGNFRGIPTTFLLNAEHELERRYSGLVTRKMVESDLSHLFDEQA
jgi:peroxiredoxin